MSNSVFVGRETELRQLDTFLSAAAHGQAQVVFIAGEAGAGKSTLVAEFVRRAEDTDLKLISATGECNAQTGAADPYLPFRQVLTALTTGNDAEKKPGAADEKKLDRWKEFVQVAGKTLLMVGPDLVGIFVPGGQILTRIGTTIGLNTNLAAKLSEKIGKKSGDPKIDPALDQERIFEQYAAVLKVIAREHTLVLILDDLQWADSGSTNLLFYLARQLKDSRVLLVGTYRPDDVALGRDGARHPLESILNELKRYNGDIVIDLSQAAAREGSSFVDALVDAEPNRLDRRFRDELFTHTGGQPLFTVELLRNLQERGNLVRDAQEFWIQGERLDWGALPARIEGVIGERVARLPADLHETLTIASVIGQEFAAQVVGRVQHVDERELVRKLSRELEKRYLLVIEGGEIKVGRQFLTQYHFSHVMIQHYLYEELGAGERRLLHAEIAETLEALYAVQAGEIAVQLARHFEAGGDAEKAVAYLIMAGDNAFQAYAHVEAIAAYSRALELGERDAASAEQISHAYLRRGRALELNSQYELALQNYADMLANAKKRRDRGMELSAKVAASTLYSTPNPIADAVKGQSLSEETLKLARELGDRAAESKVLWNLQLVHLLQNKAHDAIGYGEKSLAIARELDLREQMAYVLSDLGWAYIVDCQFEESGRCLEEGARLWQELGNRVMLSNNLNLSLFQFYWTGEDDRVLSVADETYRISSSIKEVWNQASARNFQGLVWLEEGEVDQALAAMEESIHLAAQGNPVYEIWYIAILCQAYGDYGLIDAGMEVYRERRVANKDVPHAPSHSGTLISYALFELASGQLDAATATLADCQPDAAPWETMHRLARCRLTLARGNVAEGVTLAESSIEIANEFKLGRYLAEALFLKGKGLALQGDVQEAKLALEQARAAAESLGSRRLLWQIIASLAEIETDPERVTALRMEARGIVQFIADHITDQDLREAFLQSTKASMVLS
jgi:predicted ATPase